MPGATPGVAPPSMHLYPESKPSRISTGALAPRFVKRLHVQPMIGRGLRPRLLSYEMGHLILGRVSHLDAFSGYRCPTWLPSDAPGGTTGTLEVGPFWSSRTKNSSPQMSCAHSG